MVDVKKAKPAEKEEEAFFQEVVAPALDQLQAAAESWTPTEMPEFEGDPLDLTPEEEAEIYRRIRRSRGHHDD